MARILVIDDDTEIRSSLKAALEDEGHQVKVAEDGLRGLDLVGRTAFDAVITDIVMPEVEGIETILGIRKIFPDLPILAISGEGLAAGGRLDYLEIARRFGATDVLRKPFSTQSLVERLEACLAAEPPVPKDDSA
jgi:DNA-binding response OmpR family regulator